MHHERISMRQLLIAFLAFLNPLREPAIIIATLATFVEEVGEALPWYVPLFICCINLLAIKLLTRLVMDSVCICLDAFLLLWKQHQRRRETSKLAPSPRHPHGWSSVLLGGVVWSLGKKQHAS